MVVVYEGLLLALQELKELMKGDVLNVEDCEKLVNLARRHWQCRAAATSQGSNMSPPAPVSLSTRFFPMRRDGLVTKIHVRTSVEEGLNLPSSLCVPRGLFSPESSVVHLGT